MNISDFNNYIVNIVYLADILKKRYVTDYAPVNYACIFCQTEYEYTLFNDFAWRMGKVVQDTPTGQLFQIPKLSTIVGTLQLLKIQKPDPSRTEKWDADFTLMNYNQFKVGNLWKNGFSFIQRETLERIELKEKNYPVRVYFSNPPLITQLNIHS